MAATGGVSVTQTNLQPTPTTMGVSIQNPTVSSPDPASMLQLFIPSSDTGIVQQATGGMVQQAAGIVQQTTGGMVQQAIGIVQQTTGGMVQQAAGIVQQTTGGMVQQQTGDVIQSTLLANVSMAQITTQQPVSYVQGITQQTVSTTQALSPQLGHLHGTTKPSIVTTQSYVQGIIPGNVQGTNTKF